MKSWFGELASGGDELLDLTRDRSPRTSARGSVLEADPVAAGDVDEIENPADVRAGMSQQHARPTDPPGERDDLPDTGGVEERKVGDIEDDLTLTFERSFGDRPELQQRVHVELTRQPHHALIVRPSLERSHAPSLPFPSRSCLNVAQRLDPIPVINANLRLGRAASGNGLISVVAIRETSAQGGSLPEEIAHRLPHAPSAPEQARSLAVEVAKDASLGSNKADDFVLMVSEMVTNAVRHAPPEDDGRITLRFQLEESVARVAVEDGGPDFTFEQATFDNTKGDTHLGLQIVDRLADRWGLSLDGKKAVWFEVDLD